MCCLCHLDSLKANVVHSACRGVVKEKNMFPTMKRLRDEQLSESESNSECVQKCNADSNTKFSQSMFSDCGNEKSCHSKFSMFDDFTNNDLSSKEKNVIPKVDCCFEALFHKQSACDHTCKKNFGNDSRENTSCAYEEGFLEKTKVNLPLLSQNTYFLNKSCSKWVSIGLSSDSYFEPLVRIAGVKKQCITLTVEEWQRFLMYKQKLLEYFQDSHLNVFPVIYSYNVRMSFDCFDGSNKVLKLDKNGEYLYLSYDGLCELWKMVELIKYRLDNLKALEYEKYYKSLIETLVLVNGNLEYHIERIFNGVISEHACITKEILKYYLDRILLDLQLYKQTIV